MTNLLRADFRRLFKSRAFYICTALLFIAGTALPLIHYITMHEYPQAMSFDMYFTVYALIAVVALAAFSALFVGADYSDGTIRNKLVAGARRGGVYLSNLTVQTVTGLILCAAYLVPYVIIGTSLLGDFPENGVRLILVSLAMTVSFASVFTLITMLSSSKARSAVICLVCAIALAHRGAFPLLRCKQHDRHALARAAYLKRCPRAEHCRLLRRAHRAGHHARDNASRRARRAGA